MRQDHAELIGLQALGWLAADPRLGPAFLAATGVAPADLHAAAEEPAMLAAVLDFVLQSDATALAFAASAGLAPEQVLAARRALPGGDEVHWT